MTDNDARDWIPIDLDDSDGIVELTDGRYRVSGVGTIHASDGTEILLTEYSRVRVLDGRRVKATRGCIVRARRVGLVEGRHADVTAIDCISGVVHDGVLEAQGCERVRADDAHVNLMQCQKATLSGCYGYVEGGTVHASRSTLSLRYAAVTAHYSACETYYGRLLAHNSVWTSTHTAVVAHRSRGVQHGGEVLAVDCSLSAEEEATVVAYGGSLELDNVGPLHIFGSHAGALNGYIMIPDPPEIAISLDEELTQLWVEMNGDIVYLYAQQRADDPLGLHTKLYPAPQLAVIGKTVDDEVIRVAVPLAQLRRTRCEEMPYVPMFTALNPTYDSTVEPFDFSGWKK